MSGSFTLAAKYKTLTARFPDLNLYSFAGIQKMPRIKKYI